MIEGESLGQLYIPARIRSVLLAQGQWFMNLPFQFKDHFAQGERATQSDRVLRTSEVVSKPGT